MDTKPFHLLPSAQVSLARSAVLQSAARDIVPGEQQLQELTRDILEYKKQHEQRLKHCDDLRSSVDERYSVMKERDRSKVKQLKKEPLDGLGQPPRVSKATQPVLRIPGPSTATTSSPQPALPPIAAAIVKPLQRASSAALRGSDTSVSKTNKKKRRRADEADEFMADGATRNATPVPKSHGHKEHKSKKAKHDDHDLRMHPAGIRRITDWSESVKGGLPPKPPKNPLPIPQTDDPNEVHDDMSERKQPPNQVTTHTYWNFIEPWTRQVKDEDVAFLAISGDDDELWEMPPLERHYSELWEDQDRLALDIAPLNRSNKRRTHNPYSAFTDPPPPSAGGSMQPAPNSGVRWDPATLLEADTATDEHGSGPLTERVFSAFMHLPTSSKLEEDESFKGGPGLGRAAGQGTVGDLEERLMKECKALGLIMENEEPDYSQPQDDQIASELRRCQRALKLQLQVNEVRKKRLLGIAELRLSYADYEEAKEGMERNISNMFAKLGNTGANKVTKKKKKEKEKVAAAAAVNPATGEPAGIAGLGLVGMDGNLQIPNEIWEAVCVLRRWKSEIGEAFEKLERDNPGLVRRLPKKSIYEGLDEEIARLQGVPLRKPAAIEGPSGSKPPDSPDRTRDSSEDVMMLS